MTIQVPTLPYEVNALEPMISRAALENHLNNHHKRYVERVNKLVEGTPLADATLDEIVKTTARRKTSSDLFNNAAQAWNHAFFWKSMKPKSGGQPTGPIRAQIETDFRGYDKFAAKFRKAANGHFGSGWAWLVIDVNKLKVATTKDANTPSTRGLKPILALDLWEHAYYMDYRSKRAEYVDQFLSSLLNWDFANENLSRANVTPMVSSAGVVTRIERHIGPKPAVQAVDSTPADPSAVPERERLPIVASFG